MGAHRFERHAGRRTVGFAVIVLILIAAWGAVPAAADFFSRPSIEGQSVSNLASTDATLEAQISPGGLETTYEFRLETPECQMMAGPGPMVGCELVGSGKILPGSSTVTVSTDIAKVWQKLTPNTRYLYVVFAKNAIGSAEGRHEGSFTTPPAIESESVSNITATDATIEAQINTGGRETTYRVWVGNYPECIEEMVEECDSSAKHPITGILTGSSSSTRITVDVAHAWHALSPGSSYIYNVDATNSAWAFQGSAYGENKTFTTPAAKAPAIDSESVSHVTPTDATLEAQINTEGLETTYEFLLGGSACRLCMSPTYQLPLPSGKLLGSFMDQSVSIDLNSAGVTLAPYGYYEYSVTATNAAGTTTGPTQAFTKPEGVVQPLGNAGPSTLSGGQSGTSSAPSGSGGSSSTPSANAPGLQIAKTTALKSPTNARKLAKALKLCAKKPKKRRASCRKQAHKYAAIKR
jgi:hypothetical protein